MTEPITRFDGEHAFLSNFHPSPLQGPFNLPCATVEHAFQAAKTVDFDEAKAITQAATPGQAKRMGRRVTLREGWEMTRVGHMNVFLRRKFVNPTLRNQLLATGEAELIEGNTWGDRFWGVCDGVGRNELGKLLMTIRRDIRR